MAFSRTTHLTTPVTDRDHTTGRPDAPVTLVEYGDYECPYCGEADRTIRLVRQRLGDDLRFVFRNFPLVESHPHAMEAAEAAELAARAGKFWEMHDLLYDNQRRLGTSDLVGYASSLGLNGDEFREGLAGHAMRARIGEDVLTGEESGVQGTPWFFINGEYYDGTWEPEELLAALRAAVQTG